MSSKTKVALAVELSICDFTPVVIYMNRPQVGALTPVVIYMNRPQVGDLTPVVISYE